MNEENEIARKVVEDSLSAINSSNRNMWVLIKYKVTPNSFQILDFAGKSLDGQSHQLDLTLTVKVSDGTASRATQTSRITTTFGNNTYSYKFWRFDIEEGGQILDGHQPVGNITDNSITVTLTVSNSTATGLLKNGSTFSYPSISMPVSKPTVSTIVIPVDKITRTTADTSFKITNTGDRPIQRKYTDLFRDQGLTDKVSFQPSESAHWSNLTPNTNYWVQGNATNSVGTTYTSVATFKTTCLAPHNFVLNMDGVSAFGGTLNYSVEGDINAPINKNTIIITNKKTGAIQTFDDPDGKMFVFTGLTPETGYDVQVKSENAGGISTSEVITFYTLTDQLKVLVFNGAQWAQGKMFVNNGTNGFVKAKHIYVHNGTSWEKVK